MFWLKRSGFVNTNEAGNCPDVLLKYCQPLPPDKNIKRTVPIFYSGDWFDFVLLLVFMPLFDNQQVSDDRTRGETKMENDVEQLSPIRLKHSTFRP